jgi:hypothetical protein
MRTEAVRDPALAPAWDGAKFTGANPASGSAELFPSDQVHCGQAKPSDTLTVVLDPALADGAIIAYLTEVLQRQVPKPSPLASRQRPPAVRAGRGGRPNLVHCRCDRDREG